MTAIQMNAEILRNMSIIAEDENLLKRAAKYLRKLVSEKEADPTLDEELIIGDPRNISDPDILTKLKKQILAIRASK